MDFELFIGRNGKKYYVFESQYYTEQVKKLALKEVARMTKRNRGDLRVIPVWVEGANMYDSKTAGAKKKWAVVRG